MSGADGRRAPLAHRPPQCVERTRLRAGAALAVPVPSIANVIATASLDPALQRLQYSRPHQVQTLAECTETGQLGRYAMRSIVSILK